MLQRGLLTHWLAVLFMHYAATHCLSVATTYEACGSAARPLLSACLWAAPLVLHCIGYVSFADCCYCCACGRTINETLVLFVWLPGLHATTRTWTVCPATAPYKLPMRPHTIVLVECFVAPLTTCLTIKLRAACTCSFAHT